MRKAFYFVLLRFIKFYITFLFFDHQIGGGSGQKKEPDPTQARDSEVPGAVPARSGPN